MTIDHVRRMAETYSTGAFARVVDAGGDAGYMNLGWAPDLLRPGSTAARQRNVARLIIRAVDPRPGQTILDVGCGKGGMVSLVSRAQPAAHVVGVNIDYHQLAIAADAVPGGQWAVADAVRLPFNDGVFDALLSVELLSHVPSKALLAREFARVLAPDGRAVIAFIALTRPFSEFTAAQRAHLCRVADLFSEDPHDIPLHRAALDAFNDAGLALETSVDLSDGVFAPRYEAFRRLLRALTHQNPVLRWAARTAAAWRWRLDPAEFVTFLKTNTAAHPCRFYEYHLVSLWKSSREVTLT